MTDPTPIEREVTDDRTVDFKGIPVTFPGSAEDLGLDTVEAFENMKVVTAIRGTLGAGYEKLQADFKAKHGRPLQLRDLEELVDLVAVAYGFDRLGE